MPCSRDVAISLYGSPAGADKVKEALSARKMKCGGTPLQRAQRLFQCRERELTDLPANLFQKGYVPSASLDESARLKRLTVVKRTANVEQKVCQNFIPASPCPQMGALVFSCVDVSAMGNVSQGPAQDLLLPDAEFVTCIIVSTWK